MHRTNCIYRAEGTGNACHYSWLLYSHMNVEYYIIWEQTIFLQRGYKISLKHSAKFTTEALIVTVPRNVKTIAGSMVSRPIAIGIHQWYNQGQDLPLWHFSKVRVPGFDSYFYQNSQIFLFDAFTFQTFIFSTTNKRLIFNFLTS